MSFSLGEEMHMSKTDHSWCLVLVIWGGKYSDKFVEALVKSVKQHSKGCKHIVLITDHIRNDLSDCQSQSKKGPDRGVKLVPFYSAIDITPD